MEKDKLTQLWSGQQSTITDIDAQQLILKSNKQRNKQLIGIVVMVVTLVILAIYAVLFLPQQWNTFSLGLLLMIGSLTFRIALEFYYRWIKETRLVTMDYKAFQDYLTSYYKSRRWINYVITPICFGLYCYGLILLFPYFKREFSDGFYTYLIYSGALSLLIIAVIIIYGIIKEHRFMKSMSNM